MITEFDKLSEHLVVLNARFNVMGEPIVGSPTDALGCFYSTGLDLLAIGSFIIRKPRVSVGILKSIAAQ
jgi:carbamoyltransferase